MQSKIMQQNWILGHLQITYWTIFSIYKILNYFLFSALRSFIGAKHSHAISVLIQADDDPDVGSFAVS